MLGTDRADVYMGDKPSCPMVPGKEESGQEYWVVRLVASAGLFCLMLRTNGRWLQSGNQCLWLGCQSGRFLAKARYVVAAEALGVFRWVSACWNAA